MVRIHLPVQETQVQCLVWKERELTDGKLALYLGVVSLCLGVVSLPPP